jgi:hypothetical protein
MVPPSSVRSREVQPGEDPIAHANGAVDDHGHHVVSDAALHQRLDRIAHGAEAQAVAGLEVDSESTLSVTSRTA